MPRHLAAPWIVEEIPGGFRVSSSNGFRLAYIYADTNAMQSASMSDTLTRDEARRVAKAIARLPELLKPKTGDG